MTLNQLASKIAKAEGKKHQATIGDIREILKIIVDLSFEASFGNSPNEVASHAITKEVYRKVKKVKVLKRSAMQDNLILAFEP